MEYQLIQTDMTFPLQVNNNFIFAVERESFVDQVREIIEKVDEMLSEDVSVEPEGDQGLESLQGKEDCGFSSSQVSFPSQSEAFFHIRCYHDANCFHMFGSWLCLIVEIVAEHEFHSFVCCRNRKESLNTQFLHLLCRSKLVNLFVYFYL